MDIFILLTEQQQLSKNPTNKSGFVFKNKTIK